MSRGLQVFIISWRNPSPDMGGLSMDPYAARILSAMDVVGEICETPDVSLIGFCAGGILTSTVLNHLAAKDDDRVRAASFAVTLLDFDSRAALGAFSAPRLLELAEKNSRRAGIITGRQLGNVFSWMRPDDLVFNYWVSNYLMGEPPPVFDILAWNADSTNLPARLHAEFLDIFKNNTLCKPGAVKVLGRCPVISITRSRTGPPQRPRLSGGGTRPRDRFRRSRTRQLRRRRSRARRRRRCPVPRGSSACSIW